MVWNNFPEVGIGTWDLFAHLPTAAVPVPGTSLVSINLPTGGVWCIQWDIGCDGFPVIRCGGTDFNQQFTAGFIGGGTQRLTQIRQFLGPTSGASPSQVAMVNDANGAATVFGAAIRVKLLQSGPR